MKRLMLSDAEGADAAGYGDFPSSSTGPDACTSLYTSPPLTSRGPCKRQRNRVYSRLLRGAIGERIGVD